MFPINVFALSIFKKLPAGVDALAFIGGGCFRSHYDGNPVKDYDLFFASLQDWQTAVQWFRKDSHFTEVTNPGEEMYPSFTNGTDAPFNLIGFRFHKNAISLYQSFDFVCCAFAAEMIEPGVVEISHHPHAIYEAAHKLLSFQNIQHISRVARRRKRYVEQYGYTETDSFLESIHLCHVAPRETGHGGGGY